MSISGDGGFKMTGMELYTAVCEGLPFVSIVINNSCLGMVRQWQQVFYNQSDLGTLGTPGQVVSLIFLPDSLITPTPAFTPTRTATAA